MSDLARIGLITFVFASIGCAGSVDDNGPDPVASAPSAMRNAPACPNNPPIPDDYCPAWGLTCGYHTTLCSHGETTFTCQPQAGSHGQILVWSYSCLGKP